jgi:hypothetical protein
MFDTFLLIVTGNYDGDFHQLTWNFTLVKGLCAGQFAARPFASCCVSGLFSLFFIDNQNLFTSGCFQFATAHIAEITQPCQRRLFETGLFHRPCGHPCKRKIVSLPGDFVGER